MGAASGSIRIAGVLFGALILLGVPAAVGAAGPERAAWYVDVGAGAGWSATMDKAGHNRDTTCSPNRDCGGRPVEGFRWFQHLVPETGHAFAIAVGRQAGRLRFDLSATQQIHPVALEFIGTTYLDGSGRAPHVVDSPYTSRSTNTVDELTTRSLSVNVYRDFPVPGFRATPYLGAGLGIAHVEVSGLYFHSDYSCREGRSCDPPADRYDTVKSADLTDVVPAAHLYAGVAWHLGDRWALDVKLAYRTLGDLGHRTAYVRHEFPGLTFHEAVRGIRQGSVLLSARYTWADGTTP